jgi:hypothetical protein
VITLDDLVVPCKCQWTPDLQKQGVPVFKIQLGHRQVMRKPLGATRIAEIIRERQRRWSASEVAAVRDELLKVKKVN